MNFLADGRPRPPRAVGIQCEESCGDLTWTIEEYGKVTHKHHCPARAADWCQTHEDGCPPSLKARRLIELGVGRRR